jgi:hypothetical protein
MRYTVTFILKKEFWVALIGGASFGRIWKGRIILDRIIDFDSLQILTNIAKDYSKINYNIFQYFFMSKMYISTKNDHQTL